jgi:hypothetical protein
VASKDDALRMSLRNQGPKMGTRQIAGHGYSPNCEIYVDRLETQNSMSIRLLRELRKWRTFLSPICCTSLFAKAQLLRCRRVTVCCLPLITNGNCPVAITSPIPVGGPDHPEMVFSIYVVTAHERTTNSFCAPTKASKAQRPSLSFLQPARL